MIKDVLARWLRPRPIDMTVSLANLLDNFSLEVMPKTLARVADLEGFLPKGTRVYIACLQGTDIADMVAAARRLNASGYAAMPHIPARMIRDKSEFRNWLTRYRDEAGVTEALVLAGGTKSHGDYSSSMALLETGLFDQFSFRRLHVAGHPERNNDIDPDGGDRNVFAALKWKQDFAKRTDAKMGIVTQFVFDAKPVQSWIEQLRREHIDLPVHIGVAGPARLQALIKYAIACGIGPSMKVLQKRALDVTKLALPYEPTDLLAGFAHGIAEEVASAIECVHFFPLGGIDPCVEWVRKFRNAKNAGNWTERPQALNDHGVPHVSVLQPRLKDRA
ncbi:methylenetetrahydrofolate reductase [Mesorhizobium sp. CO1-1-9]|uniref:methylenetetrahydrofolate reductase n=1 Tax=Mesorhizobium sp. CO1-1-9 TaxID=2876630 RepID=UPI001CCA0AC4|nr:methylenetetrahydrofolate reductase [Mesorhizobium sp. CO1-1-9]MBZ9694930.1 methylenetetrahydrofolate reductase [Mesorhizobium sp. CO1-1-9]